MMAHKARVQCKVQSNGHPASIIVYIINFVTDTVFACSQILKYGVLNSVLFECTFSGPFRPWLAGIKPIFIHETLGLVISGHHLPAQSGPGLPFFCKLGWAQVLIFFYGFSPNQTSFFSGVNVVLISFLLQICAG